MATLESVFEVGPTHHLIGHLEGADKIGAFELREVQGQSDSLGADRALWSADSRSQGSLEVSATHKGYPVNGVPDHEIGKIRDSTSSLHYARGMRWTSQALLAARTPNDVFGGSAWTSLIHEDERVLAAFSLWANSTLGMVVHWTRGQRTQSGRSRTQVGAVRQVPCPRLHELGGAALDGALGDYERLKGKVLKPACQAHADPTRHEVDEAALRMLGLSRAKNTLATVRRLWCEEPSVHGNNREALGLLKKSVS